MRNLNDVEVNIVAGGLVAGGPKLECFWGFIAADDPEKKIIAGLQFNSTATEADKEAIKTFFESKEGPLGSFYKLIHQWVLKNKDEL